MDVRHFNTLQLSEIIDKAIDTVYSRGDWYDVFPKITGYKYFIPEGYEDMEENPDTFRGVDFAVAHETVKHADLHPKIKELIKIIIVGNVVLEDVIMADMFEHAGTSYAVEMALFDKKYVIQYAEFLFTNDLYFERFQRYDFTGIIRKWNWSYETFYLLFVRWISESEHASDDIDYLNYNGFPLHKGLLDNEQVLNEFFRAMKDFLIYIAFDAKNEELSKYATERFSLLFSKHIYPKDEENISRLNNRFSELLEELKKKKEEESTATIEKIAISSPPRKRYRI